MMKSQQEQEHDDGHRARTLQVATAIMIIVFGTFAFSRVLAAQLLGFGLAVAVLLDATLIRMVLVPSFMHIAGDWNWWPGGRRVRKSDGTSGPRPAVPPAPAPAAPAPPEDPSATPDTPPTSAGA